MRRRGGIVCFAALSLFLLCGATSPPGCTSAPSKPIGPSTGEVVGIGVAIVATVVVATVVLVHVHNSHYSVRGCVTAGPDGLKVHENGSGKVYALSGVTANAKPGDVIKLHGAKVKGQKDSAGDQEFVVESINKDYGPCTNETAAPPAGTPPAPSATQ
jgi:hypothetical protein